MAAAINTRAGLTEARRVRARAVISTPTMRTSLQLDGTSGRRRRLGLSCVRALLVFQFPRCSIVGVQD
jgi:hypothetical protein